MGVGFSGALKQRGACELSTRWGNALSSLGSPPEPC